MEKLEQTLKELQISYDDKMLRQFDAYRSEILRWNEQVNLTAVTDADEFETKHFVDSVQAAASNRFQGAQRIADVGTGAGFPGVPLAILYPEKQFVLIDSLAKRLRILDEVCQKLGITNIKTVHGRAEDIGQDSIHREAYDLCLSRAVAPLPVLAELCLPLVKRGGAFGAYKTEAAGEEIRRAAKAIAILGGRTAEETQGTAACADGHRIVWIEKESPTPRKYPRKAGTPAKNPL